jgi:imidazolonepropionase-like amidohydrolase
VLVEGGRIVYAGPRDAVDLPEHVERIDASGRTVLPGLIDMHVHSQSPVDMLLYIKNGVTSIRFAGGLQRDILALRARIDRGEIPGPRIFSCGPLLDSPPVAHPAHTEEVRDPEHARQVVDRLIDHEQVDALIVTQRITRETLAAILEQAHARNIPVTGQNWLVSAQAAVEMGIDGQENTARIPESPAVPTSEIVDYPSIAARLATLARLWQTAPDEQLDRLAVLMAERNVFLCPTLVSFESWARLVEREVLEDPDVRQHVGADELAERDNFLTRLSGAWSDEERQHLIPAAIARFKQFIGRFHSHGGRVVSGTDLPLGGVMLHRELAHLASAGLAPVEVLATATRDAGISLRAAPLGTLVPDAPADLIVVDGNPLDDLACLRQPSEVLVGGRLVVRDGALV